MEHPQMKCPNEIWEMIFAHLKDANTQTLKACRETCSDFKIWVDKKTSFLTRISLNRLLQANQLELCRYILENPKIVKNPADEKYGQTLLHKAAFLGHYDICHLIIENVEDKNPSDQFGRTPLHKAAQKGHTEICRLIIKNVQEKNP